MSNSIKLIIKNIDSLETNRKKIKDFVYQNSDIEKQNNTLDYFLKSIEKIYQNAEQIISYDGNYKYYNKLEHNNLFIEINFDIKSKKSLFEKIINLFKN